MAKISGAKELRKALRRAGDDIRQEATKEVRESTKKMHRKAMELMGTAATFAPLHHGGAGMQDISGTARRAYRYSVTDKGLKGRVGLLSSAANQKAFYLRFFLMGTSHQPSRNFHDTAFEGERDDFIVAQGNALQRVLRMMG